MFIWDGISEFIAVVETGSFTAAGKRLGISTAQVSRQINSLETRLALKLFYRTTRRVTVTETGQLYYQQCKPLIEGLEEAELVISNLQATPRGKLKLTAPVTYGERAIAPAINRFCLQYPELEVELQLSNRKLDLVDENFDLAIRLGQLADSSMMAKKLHSRRQYVCAAPTYLNAKGAPHSLSELGQHNCLVGSVSHWRFAQTGKMRTIKVKGSLQCNSGKALLDAALLGIGIVQLPDYYVAEHLKQGTLVEVLRPFRQEDDGIWAVYPHNRHLSPKIRLLLEHLDHELNR
ncbi:LysR substrate-binding domain-containing protein [Ferrimonas lipolytica]|uniref:LysR family transcriptional regulator n=1 Tax=Ferrimonas lipolytica TaxID=2724191 RepID=A0A6H1UC05_9GAMM|nr:LysR substrate-binding domain-containing protein [Ferrimonas lipolytica]QIZ75736.1 LysR family transcriptional regulator [Ferrimonas lipolytica]